MAQLRLGTSSQPVPCRSQARVKEEGWAWGQQPHPVKTVTATETSTRVNSSTHVLGQEGSPQRLRMTHRSEAKRKLQCRIFSQPGQLLTSVRGIFGHCSRLGRQRKFPQRGDDRTSQFSACVKQDGRSLAKFA